MKPVLMAIVLAVFAGAVIAKPAKGYIKKDGTYVQPHQKTAPNKTKDDNHSTKGNTNPYTGKKGTKPRESEQTTKQ